MASKKKTYLVEWIIGMAAIVAAFLVWSISFSPLWLFTKYRPLRKVIIAQARFETANFTSSLYWRARNCFGMKIATKRFTWRLYKSGEYSGYLFPIFSLADLFAYFNDFGWSREDVINLTSGATDSQLAANYCSKLWLQGYFTSDLNSYIDGVKNYMK